MAQYIFHKSECKLFSAHTKYLVIVFFFSNLISHKARCLGSRMILLKGFRLNGSKLAYMEFRRILENAFILCWTGK